MQDEVRIFFSAHGVPVSYVEEAGDPYKEEMEQCVQLIMGELQRRGVDNEHVLAYQSRVGPVKWLQPYTDDTIRWGWWWCRVRLSVLVSSFELACKGEACKGQWSMSKRCSPRNSNMGWGGGWCMVCVGGQLVRFGSLRVVGLILWSVGGLGCYSERAGL